MGVGVAGQQGPHDGGRSGRWTRGSRRGLIPSDRLDLHLSAGRRRPTVGMGWDGVGGGGSRRIEKLNSE